MKKYKLTKNNLFNTYGYNYTTLDIVLTILLFAVVITSVCYFHKLNMMYSVCILITVGIMIPFIISSFFKYKSEKRKFEEYCLYFESMKMFFKVYKKLSIALEETYKLFDEKSKMACCIKKAIEEIKDTGDYEKALAYVDDSYHNTYLGRLHSLLITGEKQGSDSVYKNLDNINYADWKEDMCLFQKSKKSARYMFYFLALLSVGLSIFSIVIYGDDEMLNSIITSDEYQLYTLIELELLMMMFVYIYIDLVNKKWIRSDE